MKVVNSKSAPWPVGPYSHAIISGNLVFTAGQLGLDPATKTLKPDIKSQTIQACDNLVAILKEAGTSADKVVKTTIFMKDMGDYAVVNEVYAKYFGTNPPGRSAVQVAKLPLDALVEIECIAEL